MRGRGAVSHAIAAVFTASSASSCKPLAALRDIGDDLIAHAPLPEFLEMIGDARHGFVVRVSGKEQGDLVRPVNHRVRFML